MLQHFFCLTKLSMETSRIEDNFVRLVHEAFGPKERHYSAGFARNDSLSSSVNLSSSLEEIPYSVSSSGTRVRTNGLIFEPPKTFVISVQYHTVSFSLTCEDFAILTHGE